ncbi:hypothetical protein V8B97DRAFT_1984526 [Scleroderma yunnanense]
MLLKYRQSAASCGADTLANCFFHARIRIQRILPIRNWSRYMQVRSLTRSTSCFMRYTYSFLIGPSGAMFSSSLRGRSVYFLRPPKSANCITASLPVQISRLLVIVLLTRNSSVLNGANRRGGPDTVVQRHPQRTIMPQCRLIQDSLARTVPRGRCQTLKISHGPQHISSPIILHPKDPLMIALWRTNAMHSIGHDDTSNINNICRYFDIRTQHLHRSSLFAYHTIYHNNFHRSQGSAAFQDPLVPLLVTMTPQAIFTPIS